MMTRVIPADFTIDRTVRRSRRRPIVIAVLLFIAAMTLAPFMIGCGSDVVAAEPVAQAMTVVDPGHLVSSADLELIINHVIDTAPPQDKAKIRPTLEAYTMAFVADSVVPCDNPEPAAGCTTGNDVIRVAGVGTTCYDQQTMAGIIAHEIGHAIGYSGHDYVPWFGDDGDGHHGMDASTEVWWCNRYYELYVANRPTS